MIELLVGVMIIALLLSLLTPSLWTTRCQGKLVNCMANMSVIAKASLIYAQEDATDLVIPIPNAKALEDGPGLFEWGGKAGIGELLVPGQHATSLWGTGKWRGPAHRPLNKYMYKSVFADWNPIAGPPNPGPQFENYLSDTKLDLAIFQCPADTGYATGGFSILLGTAKKAEETRLERDGLSAYDHYGTSYVANCFWQIRCGPREDNAMLSCSPYLQPASRIPSPARTILYDEVPARWAWGWGRTWDGCGPCIDPGVLHGEYNTIPGWHQRPFNFVAAFADGHAQMIEMKGSQSPPPRLADYPAKAGCESDPHACYRCMIVRGPGWQLDTLPAPPVVTQWR